MSYVDVFGTYTVPPSEVGYTSIAIFTQATLAWPDNFSGEVPDEYKASGIVEVACALNAELSLPPANQVSVGKDILIRNIGAETLQIFDAEHNPIGLVLAGEAKYFYVIDNTTAAGVWSVFTYGTGTSGADASLLAGPGLAVMGGQLRSDIPYRGFNSDYTVIESDIAQLFDALNGNITLTLPSAAVAGSGFYIFFRNSSDANVTVALSGIDTIDGDMSLTAFPGNSAIISSNGSKWSTVGLGKDSTFIFSETIVDATVGSVTLTSAQVAGRMIRVVGVAAADFVVTLPQVDNIYFVSAEAGLGAFKAEFTTGAGSSVFLDSSSKTVIYSDGINVTTAINTALVTSLSLNDGTVTSPSIFYSSDGDTGFYRPGNGQVSFTSNGVEKVRFGVNGVELGSRASSTAFTPSGNVIATNVQAAIQEVDAEKLKIASNLSDLNDAATARTNLGLGTAATADVTTSATDTTAGRLLKVGDHGIGATVPLLAGVDCNTLTTPSKYCITNATNAPINALTFILDVLPSFQDGRVAQRAFVSHPISTPQPDIKVREFVRTSTPDNLWSPWREIYHQGSILGTVSQSGGIPTGAIIERGTNANGEYIRFADGTQICVSNKVSAPSATAAAGPAGWFRATPDTTVIFPASFIAAPNVSVAALPFSGSFVVPIHGSPGTGGVQASLLAISSGTLGLLRVTAVGRWF